MPSWMEVLLALLEDRFPVALTVDPICNAGYRPFTACPHVYSVTLFRKLVLPVPTVWATRLRQDAKIALVRVQTPEESQQVFSALRSSHPCRVYPGRVLDWTRYGMEFVRRLWQTKTILQSLSAGQTETAQHRQPETTTTGERP